MDLSVAYLVIRFWFDGLSGKTREARWQSISKCGRHSVDERLAGARGTRKRLAGTARKKLPGFGGSAAVGASVRAHLGNHRRARFDEDITSAFITMNENRPARYGSREKRSMKTIRAASGFRFPL